MELSVWAPNARRVAVELGSTSRPLERAERGYWKLPEPGIAPGAPYVLRLDSGPPRPDPRSQWQADGVHGPSRFVDHGAFRWTDAGFEPPPLATGVIYELHVGTFTPAGTFVSTIERLDHLVQLGVTHVELMPVAQFPGQRGWGYDGVALFAPHGAYGTPGDLKRLVDACHARGLAVLLDVVYNHLGPDGNYLAEFGPYFTHEYTTPWGDAVNFDQAGSDEVRRFFCDNALYWLSNYHFDGLRLDAVHAYIDRSAMPFLEQLGLEVAALSRELGRSKVLIAESDLNDPRLIRSPAEGGFGLDAQWSDDFHHSLHALLSGERQGYYADFGAFDDLARALRDGFVYAGRHSAFRGRRHGRPLGNVPRTRLLGYLQNHDQIGNRARGDRLGQLVSLDRLRLGSAFVLLGPFVPLIFQGEEWNASSPFCYFTDHQDPALAAAVRQGRRQEFAAFGWKPEEIPDPQSPETFAASRLKWQELDAPEHARLLAWYRALVELRRKYASRSEPLQIEQGEGERPWLVLRRGALIVCGNFGPRPVHVPLGAPGELRLASDGVRPSATGVELSGYAVAVFGS